MYEIVAREDLSADVKLFVVKAPLIAKKCQPGQFIILRMDEDGERVPLTIADFDRAKGTITLIFQEVGYSTKKMGQLKKGETILDVAGPLGTPTHMGKYGTVVCVGGGIGVAPVYPIARGFKECGNKVVSIIGARNKELLILENEMRAVSSELIVTTDDGSQGIKGFVTQPLQEMINKGEKIDLVMAIGPVVMMKGVANVTRSHKIKTFVSLNPIMVDGTGMCGGCRVSVGNQNKFACVDGPEFDAHEVDFDGLIARQSMYHHQEKNAHCGGGGCKCQ